MLNKLQKKKSETGFTIIEVMIVLAIAGLIILIVLLAVPALQRNGRNTAIKNDASAVAGLISEFRSNNDGALPTSVANTASGSATIDATGTGSPANGKVQTGTTVSTVTATPTASAAKVGTVEVKLRSTCTSSTANPRSAAVYYFLETSSTPSLKCIDA